MFKQTKQIATLAFLIGLSTVTSQAIAGEIKHAANGCFPRVFSQIDQFKVSSGGLRNTNANPRSIVCSIDNVDASQQGEQVESWIYHEALPADMECTYFARDPATGAIFDSLTFNTPAGATFTGDFLVLVHPADKWSWEVVDYVQCKVPADGRIFTTESYFFVP